MDSRFLYDLVGGTSFLVDVVAGERDIAKKKKSRFHCTGKDVRREERGKRGGEMVFCFSHGAEEEEEEKSV